MDNIDTATKTEIHAEINRLRLLCGATPLPAYKAKDLAKSQLIELLEAATEDYVDFVFDSEAEVVDAVEIVGACEAIEIVESPAPKVKRASQYNEDGLRRCGCCGEYFPVEAFGAYKSSKDGLASYTKDHTKAYRRAKKA